MANKHIKVIGGLTVAQRFCSYLEICFASIVLSAFIRSGNLGKLVRCNHIYERTNYHFPQLFAFWKGYQVNGFLEIGFRVLGWRFVYWYDER